MHSDTKAKLDHSIRSSTYIMFQASRFIRTGLNQVAKQSKRMYRPQEILKNLKNPELLQTKGYINGKYIGGASEKTFEVIDPAFEPHSEAKLTDVASMELADYETAIDVAHQTFDEFRKTTGRYRSELLMNLFGLMRENQEDLAKLIVLENGKPYSDALGEVIYASLFFQWYAEEAPRVAGSILPSGIQTNRILSIKQPVGVCGILTPWNFPSAMITRKLGAAIAAGCTAVIKPASETPLSALALGYLLKKAGFPDGVINVLATEVNNVPAVGKLICEHPKVKKVSFTGSTNVGKLLMTQSASTLKKISLELGGNAPLIVFDDADIDKAVDGAILSKFRSSGQTCVCANRIFVQESVYDEFSKRFVDKLSRVVKLGKGLETGVTHGPLIHQKSLGKVTSHIEDAITAGAKILFGGKKAGHVGHNFHELTVLGDVPPSAIILKEETFGPVAPLIKFKTEDDVISMANTSDVGLAAYFFSKNVDRIFKVAEAIDAGMVGVNTGAISEAAMPFGGVKESGFGREGSIFGVNDYTVIKSIVLGDLKK